MTETSCILYHIWSVKINKYSTTEEGKVGTAIQYVRNTNMCNTGIECSGCQCYFYLINGAFIHYMYAAFILYTYAACM